MKQTKIVATIGPASEHVPVLTKMFEAGLSVARLNFSHGSIEEHTARAEAVRTAAKAAGVTPTILQDLAGPKIRIGDFATDTVELVPGKQLILTPEKVAGTAQRVSLTYAPLAKYVKRGSRILLNDGKNQLVVTKVKDGDIYTDIIVGGTVKGRRGVNVPGAYLPIASLTKKDKADLAFGITQEADFIALSFVRTAKDVKDLRMILDKAGSRAQIISKIETQEAIEHLEDIIGASDGVMVARGDLAVEVPAAEVPLIQKRIVSLCRAAGKPVIVATHMLESMMASPSPTRAEVSDVANAILDGTDAVMLSAESALGKYPIESVRMMADIAHTIELSHPQYSVFESTHTSPIVDTVSDAVVRAAVRAKAVAIVALTESGGTARMLSRFRPDVPIICFTPHEMVQRQLALSYACTGILTKRHTTIDAVIADARSQLVTRKLAKKGDTIVISAGIPFGEVGSTNLLLVQRV